ncbi:4-oxalocrotonate tautomerase family protein [Streptomyces sp. NPDC006463]|uniref:tautomerase family protein n=1 Tax=Streptomyces sp. NPDC006463 TaxID=3364746 RepID=UPI0036AC7F59
MPLIDVKLYQDRLDERTRAELIGRLTDAAAGVLGEEVRDAVWVVLTPVPRENWGIAGKPGA